ncbi:MAG: hypothetical protein UH850_04025 [Paludibacteraceae bacterium]|nr:hypothetical protein [Paludibacteraceae bacterium]
MSDAIYKKIKEIAVEAKGNKRTRADVAYDLQMTDSLEVSRLVWEAYNYYGKDPLIKSTFINNDNDSSVVDDYELRQLITTGNNEEYFNALSKDLKDGENALTVLDNMLKTKMSEAVTSEINSLMSIIMGTKGIENVKKEATQAVELYGQLVNVYDEAKSGVKEVTQEFVDLRTEILHVYEKYAQMLVDFYGDSIKRVAPSLFDFDSIEYLDTAQMFEKVKLQYDLLSENCSVMMSEISDGFSNSVMIASQGGNALGRKGAVAIAAVEAIKHYLDASEKTVRMKSDLEAFKMNIKKDVTNIKCDYSRLATVYKTINDLYIPKADAYFKFSGKLLSAEFEQMVSTLYAKAGVAELVKERDNVMDEIRIVSEQLNDHKNNLIFYGEQLEHCQEVITEKKDDYENAKSLRPSKPSVIVNVLTFGSADKKYSQKMFKWKGVYGNLVKEYENAIVDEAVYGQDLNYQDDARREAEEKLTQLKAKQKELTDKILKTISVDTDMKKKLASHLEDIIRMLHVGKEILESGLDTKSIKAINIDTFHSNELPEDIKNAVADFKDFVNEVAPDLKEDVKNHMAKEFNEQELAEMKKVYAESLKLTDALISLEALKEQNQVSSEIYDKELEKIQEEFNSQMAKTDAKADVLGNVLKEINTAPDAEARKKALIKLTERGKTFASEEEFNNFINGTLTITI